MSTPVLEISNLGKKYKRYSRRWHRLLEWLPGKGSYHRANWVLRGICLAANRGEAVGVIGQNGSGKSTLLKILTGTTAASEGSYSIKGSVSALLELGTGFHPDFTGRENVYLNGQIMGFANEEIASMIKDIEAFAEIGDYIDQPLRTYSSGMVVRLAFAAATAARPDIFLVDEALAVGDIYFQHKCFSRIREFKAQGTTLLFVSHDPVAVKTLCDRAVLLEQGLMVKEGMPDEVLNYYNAVIAKKEAGYRIRQSAGEGTRKSTRSGNGAAKIEAARILSRGKPVYSARVGDQVEVVLTIKALAELVNPTVGIKFKDRLGNDLYGTNTYFLEENTGHLLPGEKLQVTFRLPLNFGAGSYSLSVAIHGGATHLEGNYDWWDQAATIQLIRGEEAVFAGSCYIKEVNVEAGKTGTAGEAVGGKEHAAR